jgi:hypothetical protein
LKTIHILFISIQIFITALVYSQENPNLPNHYSIFSGTSRTDGKPEKIDNYKKNNPEKTAEQESRIKELRKSQNPDFNEIEKLQKEIAGYNSESIESKFVGYPGTVRPAGMIEKFYSSVNSLMLTKSNIKGISTATEYTGATAGRIWTVIGYQGNGSSSTPDSLVIFYSTDNGTSWIAYGEISLGNTDKINPGEIDAELIEGGTNKYLHIVYGLRANGGTGRWFSAGASIRLTGSFTGNTWSLSWQGDDASKRYYCPKITSDNFVWPTAPWAYIVVSFDSAGAAGRVYTQKFAQMNTPNTTTPAIMYKPGKIYWYSETEAGKYLYTDIAFFQRNSIDSLIISYCGVGDSTKVYFSKMNSSGMVSPLAAGQYIGPVGGSEPNYMKYGGKLSSNGNNNGSIFFIFNQKSSSTDGIKYFRTTNYGDFNSLNQSVTWTAPSGVSLPDITGIRGGNTHRLCFFLKNTSSDSLKYISVSTSGNFLTVSDKLNSLSQSAQDFSPSAGIRFQSGDSCFAVYANNSLSEVRSAAGCTGVLTGIEGNGTPRFFSLSKNYPNPFNPETKIKYTLAKPQFVTLKVYDITGRIAAILVNEKKNTGSYEVTFNAEGLSSGIYFYRIATEEFSDVNKMVLVK